MNMEIQAVPDYEPKDVTKLRGRAIMLSMRFSDAADAVEQCGEASIDGERLIDANDLGKITEKLRFYAEWLSRIAAGESVTETQMVEMQAVLDSVNIPKKAFERKHEIIEVAYLGTNPHTGRPTRHRVWHQAILNGETEVVVPGLTINMEVARGALVKDKNE